MAETLVALTREAYGDLAPWQAGALTEAVDAGWRFDLEALLTTGPSQDD